MANEFVEKIQESISQCKLANIEEILGVSIGVVFTKNDISIKYVPFMKMADRLMYDSKKMGKNRATFGEFKVFK